MEVINAVFDQLKLQTWSINHDEIYRILMEMVYPQIKDMDFSDVIFRKRVAETILYKFNQVMVKPNTPVGINATLTIGENTAQDSLQSHHKAGLKKGHEGFDRVREIVELTTTNNIAKIVTTPTIITFPDGSTVEIPKDKEKVFDVANQLEKITLYNVVTHYEILKRSQQDLPAWYEIYCRIFNKVIPTGETFIRFYLDPEKVYRYKVNLGAFAEKVTNQTIYFPPISEGLFIEVYPNDDEDVYTTIPIILSYIISGLSDIQSISVIPENVLEDVQITRNVHGQWKVNHTGSILIPPSFWKYLLPRIIPDIRDIVVQYEQKSVTFSSALDVPTLMNPPLYLKDVVKSIDGLTVHFDRSVQEKYPYLRYGDLRSRTFDSKEKLDKFLLRNIVDDHYFWYIEASISPKSSIVDIYVNPEIDVRRSYVSTPLNMIDTIGYLAARRLIYDELVTNINVENIHIEVLVNSMTRGSKLISFTKNGFSNTDYEFMTSANFESILTTTAGFAFVGSTDHLTTIASRIFTGLPITIGRGDRLAVPKSADNPFGNRFVDILNRR